MSTSDLFEAVTSLGFLMLGIWGTAFAYGLVGDRLIGPLRWNVGFRRQLRWLGPLLAVTSGGALILTVRYPG